MAIKKITLDNPDPNAKKSYINAYIETEGIHPVTLEHLILDLKENPDLLKERELGPINNNKFEIKTEGAGIISMGRKVIRLKEKK